MDKTIWKYQIAITDEDSLMMPIGAEVLSIQMQNGIACIWALVDPLSPLKERYFRMAGTGHIINNPDKLKFIGTFQIEKRGLVFHLFERME